MLARKPLRNDKRVRISSSEQATVPLARPSRPRQAGPMHPHGSPDPSGRDPRPSALALLARPAADGPDDSASGPDRANTPAFDLVESDGQHLSVTDLGITRGDGIFETIGARYGRPQSLDAHLTRFVASASALDLPAPRLTDWREAIRAVSDAIAQHEESAIKTVYTRGIDGTGRPTGWVHGTRAPDFRQARVDGVHAITLDRGWRHDVAPTARWLLPGAKTLSYAVNSAALREAARRSADDVIFLSSDGFVLEGPTSTVIIRHGNRLITPGPHLPILDGTTQASVFSFAQVLGYDTGFELLRLEHLHLADAAWLVSSLRRAAPVTSIDGRRLPIDPSLTAAMNEHLGTVFDKEGPLIP